LRVRCALRGDRTRTAAAHRRRSSHALILGCARAAAGNHAARPLLRVRAPQGLESRTGDEARPLGARRLPPGELGHAGVGWPVAGERRSHPRSMAVSRIRASSRGPGTPAAPRAAPPRSGRRKDSPCNRGRSRTTYSAPHARHHRRPVPRAGPLPLLPT
jgi:hypothetical protein